MMSWLACLVVFVAQLPPSAAVQGYILDSAGQPISDALVFAENIEAGQLLNLRSGPDGAFAFDALAPGLTGIFAHAPGHAFGGFSVSLAPGDTLRDRPITLAEPASISGKVSGYKDKAAEGARIVRVALLGEQKVSIPFDKLDSYGFSVPVSRDKGRFEVGDLPGGVPVALKFSHPAYPIQAVTGLASGDTNAKAVLMPGVAVSGNTLIRGEDRAVAHVDITVTNAQPPYETTTMRSDSSGRYAVSLKPGVYTFEARATAYRSAGLQRVTVTGEAMDQRVNVFMTATGTVSGEVRDAKTDSPVAGAKLIVESSGNPAGVAYTDAAGRYRFLGASGMTKVYLAETPGYQPGETRSMEVSVPGEGEYEMPVFWVTPLGSFSVQVVDAGGEPVAGAVVTMLSPATLGWSYSDARGNAPLPIGTVPDDGRIAGIMQHPDGVSAGLFAIDDADPGDRVVQLFPLSEVHGRLEDTKGDGVGGIVVAGRLLDEEGRASLVLWQTLSRPDGTFAWKGVLPYVQQRCYAFSEARETALGPGFSVEPKASFDAGTAVVSTGTKATSAYGATIDWQALPKTSGAMQPGQPHPAVLFYAPAAEGAVIVDALNAAQPVMRGFGYQVAVILDGPHKAMEGAIPVLQGTPPGSATTYVTGPDGKVVVETFGLPPVSALKP